MNIPPEVKDIVLLSLLNPATLIVGYWMGRHADQLQKAVIVGFAAGLAGTAFVWMMMLLGFSPKLPKLLSGIFVLSTIVGVGYAALGHWTRRYRGDPKP